MSPMSLFSQKLNTYVNQTIKLSAQTFKHFKGNSHTKFETLQDSDSDNALGQSRSRKFFGR